jgi:hypothetical protein
MKNFFKSNFIKGLLFFFLSIINHKSIIMTHELVAISIFGMLTVLFGRQILEKKGIKTPKWIDYPAVFSAVLLTIYLVYDTFFSPFGIENTPKVN